MLMFGFVFATIHALKVFVAEELTKDKTQA
jgi:hypothetical protein